MIKLFCGYDVRESIGFHVFVHSVLRHASKPVSVIPLSSRGMPVGTNAFTYSRFLVPWLCNFEGRAIFADASDMLMLGDVAELDALFEPGYDVQCVRRPDYKTRHPVKYVGTSMQADNRNYPGKNWASLMVFNCAAPAWRAVEPSTLPTVARSVPRFLALQDHHVGPLPPAWNVLADEGDLLEGAKLLHWTAGIPGFPAYANAPGSHLWHATRREIMELP